MFGKLKQLHADECAATAVEHAATMFTFFLILFGIIEFSFLYYQWNAATKAVQYGARLAAVSDPIATGLRDMSGVGGSVYAGDPMPAFDINCFGANAAGSSVTCSGSITASTPSALQALVYGRDAVRQQCDLTLTGPNVGMCNYFDRLRADNVSIRYQYTGLGYAGRPGGPVPTITVSLRNMQYQFIFLGALMNLAPFNMPSFATTVTGEDLNIVGT